MDRGPGLAGDSPEAGGGFVTGSDGPWTTLSSSLKYENPWIRVIEHQVITPAGTPGIYGTVHFRSASAGVVAIDSEGCTWLVGQHRYPLRRHSWEIPVGGVNPGESPQKAAARELKEETGVRATRYMPLLSVDFSTGITDEVGYAFLAWDICPEKAEPDPTELVEVRRLPFAKALDMVEAGEIRDLFSIASLQKVRLLALENSLPPELTRLIA